MKIVTQHGFFYELDLHKQDGRTLVTGIEWNEIIEHYGLYYYDHITVNSDGDYEFFSSTIFDAKQNEKILINNPGYVIYTSGKIGTSPGSGGLLFAVSQPRLVKREY